jgi:GNAT superfamily N-acetyltransferase
LCELADLGEKMITREDIRSLWAQPNFELARDAVVILDQRRIVARADTFRTRVEMSIHPEVRGRGIGTWLLRWSEDRGRAKGDGKVRQTLLDRATEAGAMLRANGYEPGYLSWVLEIALVEEPPSPELPAGVAIREFVPGKDDRQVYRVIERLVQRMAGPRADLLRGVGGSRASAVGFRSRLDHGRGGKGATVGACVGLDYPDEGGWIQQLAVAASHRKRGIARALLQTAFHASWDEKSTRAGSPPILEPVRSASTSVWGCK